MRGPRPSPLAPSPLLAVMTLLVLTAMLAFAPWVQARKAAPKTAAKPEATQPKGERVDIGGRVAVGLDKTFIKDQSQGYFMVQGMDLSRFAGRHIQAKGVVVGQEREFRIIRLLEYSVTSPDDDSPGASRKVK